MDNPLFFLLLGLLVAWVGSYFYSFQHNRRKLRYLASWLQEALVLFGSGYTSRWQGSDRLDIIVAEGRGNIRESAIVLGMQSRQLFKALVLLVRAGRDSMTMLVSLKTGTVAGREFEIFEAKGPIPRSVTLAADSAQPWKVEDYPRTPLYRVAFRTPAARESAFAVLALLLDDGFNLRRLSVRASAPHLMLVLNLGVVPKVEAASLLRLMKNLSDEVSQPFKTESPAKSRPNRTATRRATPPGQIFPKAEDASTSEVNPNLSRNGFHTSNGHHPKED
jgi:hypothetical protein